MKSVADIFRSYGVLDADGKHVNGCDKMSNHNYGDAYERIFGSMRFSAEFVMEVGIADGSSLLAWSEVFPLAHIVGLDIHPPSDKIHGDRFEFYLGDATKQVDCERAAACRQFDVIVDDATHRQEDLLRTLLYLWPFVRPKGLYIVEEFDNVGSMRSNIKELWSFAEIIDTAGPFGGVEPLVVFRKPFHAQ